MAISLPNGLTITSKDPVDTRILLTKAEMLAAKKARMPEKYFAICKDDGKLYLYSDDNDLDEETGRFRLYTADVTAASVSSVLPAALASTMSTQEGAEQIANTLFDSEHFEVNLDNKIDLAVSLIQAIDGNE